MLKRAGILSVFFGVVFLISGCAEVNNYLGFGSDSQFQTALYNCGGIPVSAMFQEDRLTLKIVDQEENMTQVKAASGAKYQNQDTIFWEKGDEAKLTRYETDYPTCHKTTQKPPYLNFPYRAKGNEPGWILYLNTEDQARLLYDYAQKEREEVIEKVQEDRFRRVYKATDGKDFSITIEYALCNDSMSGWPYPHKVIVRMDGTVLTGCGGGKE